ncbi:hypothetical protein PINS_up005088 [Pythium insidiosum]|nr:hypothetical protein PINS_up005088 [Pythium insidiosum]
MADAFLNEPNAFGHTPLFYAASSGRLQLVKWLISNGADIDMDYSDRSDVKPRDDDLGIFSPLQIACFKGHEDVVNFLVECNATLSGTRRNGKTPLHFASSQNHKSIVRILLEAGADAHACDDDGKTPVDVATSTVLPLLLSGKGGDLDEDGSEEDEDRRLETDTTPDDDDDHDGFSASGSQKAAFESIRAAFGNDIARDFRHKSWKTRVNAINDANNHVLNGTSTKNAMKLFEGACQMIVFALQDAVSQVVSLCCTALLKSVFNAMMVTKEFHSANFHQSHPLISRISELLLQRGAGSNEKDASEAVAALLFLICKSTDITKFISHHISTTILPIQSTAISDTSTGEKSQEVTSTNVSWRLQLVAIKILNTIASQYRLDSTTSGFGFPDAVKISTTALENASVHVRTAAIDLFVQCLLIGCEQSGTSKLCNSRLTLLRKTF